MEKETFWTLLKDLPHWEFELFLIFLFDVVIGILIWPKIKNYFKQYHEEAGKIEELEKRIKALEEK